MKRLKDMAHKALHPGAAVIALLAVVSAAGLAWCFAFGGEGSAASYAVYALSAYALMAFVAACAEAAGRAVDRIASLPVLSPLLTDELARGRASALATAVFDVGYGVLTLVSGVVYGSWWSFAVGLYYAAMVVLAVHLYVGMRRASRLADAAERRAAELRAYRRCAWSLLAFNLVLAGVAFQMVNLGRSWSYPEFVVFGVAAFAFANLAMAIIGIARARRSDSLVISAARSVSLAKAVVGMFFLTTTLLVSFGDDEAFRVMMESAVGAVCMPVVVAIAVIMLRRSRPGGPLAGGEN